MLTIFFLGNIMTHIKYEWLLAEHTGLPDDDDEEEDAKVFDEEN